MNIENKHIPLVCHTNMSNGFMTAGELIDTAVEMGLPAIGIADFHSVQAFPKAAKAAEKHKGTIKVLYGAKFAVVSGNERAAFYNPYTVVCYAKSQQGLFCLYRLISLLRDYSNVDTGNGSSKAILEKDLFANKDGLLIGITENPYTFGLGCDLDTDFSVYKRFDFLLYNFNETNVEMGFDNSIKVFHSFLNQNNIPICAYCPVAYLNRQDEKAWLAYSQFAETFYGYRKEPCGPLMNTYEVLGHLQSAGEKKAYEFGVTNPLGIAEMCEAIVPLSKKRYWPVIEDADKQLGEKCNAAFAEKFDESSVAALKRLTRELALIEKNGYAPLYLIWAAMVKESNRCGRYSIARGCVANSLVAYLLGITNINPLEYDLEFEIFSGLNGENGSNIDLNFDSEIQANMRRFLPKLVPEHMVVSAGTIGTNRATKAQNIITNCPETEGYLDRIARIKRKLRFHPSGCFVIPQKYALTIPVEQIQGETVTHFNFYEIANNFLKLDILGFDALTMIYRLHSLTRTSPEDIPLDAPVVLKMFTSTEPLGVTPEQIGAFTSTLAIPGFSTPFAQKLLLTCKPQSLKDLAKVNGLLHGADVWTNNAEALILSGTANIKEVIADRDDVFHMLLKKGIDKAVAYRVTKDVRKGIIYSQGGFDDKTKALLVNSGLPNWWLNSCTKIKHLFPKGHSLEYARTSVILAWYKLHFPDAYYHVWLSVYGSKNTRYCWKLGEHLDAAISQTEEKDVLSTLLTIREAKNRGVQLNCSAIPCLNNETIDSIAINDAEDDLT